ncbi:baseplate J/gp47 family protein [Nodosilinea sp. PGN35]|uniref:baseplate J/gp47 family protein n=1 Tax=Nodosilinea sp. PGN35 TaxID=3020489 RepID=UPI0023B2B705|nr:baseplate J/gp47 family protein [Nodosilinea sp. TSF1-S3]MDF0365791.1 baseplate J/gp47 family protein [Nodosilinea sp. TSF1-S3]
MSFAPKPFEAIYTELVNSTQTRLKELGNRGEGIDLAVGSVIRTLYESFAYEMALLYEQMDQVYHSAFIDTASGLQLEMVAAILGIQRGLPDYAEGVVTFTRDAGQEDIEIPIGTLVTTEDSDRAPRKAYTTIEARLFPAADTEITVKVQAMERGETQVVAANTIAVMPLPVAGVKAVRNPEATQFLGKRLETDDELRQRAKSALLASGKASLSAIETALLSQSGVREVKVVEPGPGETGQTYGVLDIYIDDRDLETMPPSGWLPQPSQLASSPSPSADRNDNPLASTLALTEGQRQQNRVAALRQRVDQVRAAGVYVRLHGAELVRLDGMVQVAVAATADPEAVTAEVKRAIATHLAQLPLGKPLLFPPLVQAMLAVPGVANVEEFALLPHWPSQAAPSAPVLSSAKRLDPASCGLLASKFRLGDFRVVSQPQDIPVRVELRAASLTSATEQAMLSALQRWFQDALLPGAPLVKAELLAQIPASVRPRPDSLRLLPQRPSPLVRPEETALIPGFAERFVLAEPLALYDRDLGLVGALRVTLPKPLTPDERTQTWAEMRNHLQRFLHRWPPRQDLALTQLQDAASEVLAVADLDPQDFQALGSDGAADRLDAEHRAMRVEPYERLQLAHLLISDRTEPLTVTLTGLEITIRWLTDDMPSPPTVVRIRSDARDPAATPAVSADGEAAAASSRDDLLAALKTTLRNAVTTFAAQPPGQDFDLATLRQHLEATPDRSGQFRSLVFTVAGLTVTARSVDGRSQTAQFGGTSATAQTIHVRSLEQVVAVALQPTPDPITVLPPPA